MDLGDAFRMMATMALSSRIFPPVPQAFTKRLIRDPKTLRSEHTFMAVENIGYSAKRP